MQEQALRLDFIALAPELLAARAKMRTSVSPLISFDERSAAFTGLSGLAISVQ
jgi:hypothetical protein